MMTLRRFEAVAESYGADLRRWPQELRNDAQALLDASESARAILRDARMLDAAIEDAVLGEEAFFLESGGQAAALARLRSGVDGRIAALTARSNANRPQIAGNPGWVLAGGIQLALRTRWLAAITAGGIAITAGLMLGSMNTQPPPADNVMALLQPAAIHILAE